ncbi:polysaccharide deacetylase family protein [Candidatus Berkelbacteria bacterium]|nr:polysaccharide deacetylase family protein [Candidatus Berkelbacteria bacterium]
MTTLERWQPRLLWAGLILLAVSAAYVTLAAMSTPERTLPVGQLRAQLERVTDTISEAVVDTTTSLTGVNDIPVPILMYHYVREVDANTDPLGYRLSVAPAEFAAELDALQAAGYQTITPSQFLAGEITDQSIILSFDDGYHDFYTHAFPALQARGMTAVTFVVSDFIDDRERRYLTTEQISELATAGIEIGAHSVSHANLATATPERRQAELLESRFALETIIGKRVLAVAYPSGEYTDEVLGVARFVGYRFGVTTDPGVATRGAAELLALPRIAVTGGDSVEELLGRVRSAKSDAGVPAQLQPTAED